jgi:hypothetical protein
MNKVHQTLKPLESEGFFVDLPVALCVMVST